METKTTEQRGITMHTETLRMCTRRLTESEIGALIRTILHDYYPDEYPESTDRLVLSQADNLRDNIARNQSKYTTRKERNAEYWERYNKTRKQRERNKLLQELQGLQGVTIAPEVLQELTSEDTDIISNTKGTLNNTISKPKPKSKPKPNPNTNPNEVNNNTSNNEDINPNISNSNKIKYTLPEVQKILEEREIFLKKDSLKEFWHVNSVDFGWRYDPVSAAYAWLRRHPEDLRKENQKESTPPSCAVPPRMEPEVVKAAAAVEAVEYRRGCEWWNQIHKEIQPKMSNEDAQFLQEYLRVKAGRPLRTSAKLLIFDIKKGEHTIDEVCTRADAILSKHKEVFELYKIMVRYNVSGGRDAAIR